MGIYSVKNGFTRKKGFGAGDDYEGTPFDLMIQANSGAFTSLIASATAIVALYAF